MRVVHSVRVLGLRRRRKLVSYGILFQRSKVYDRCWVLLYGSGQPHDITWRWPLQCRVLLRRRLCDSNTVHCGDMPERLVLPRWSEDRPAMQRGLLRIFYWPKAAYMFRDLLRRVLLRRGLYECYAVHSGNVSCGVLLRCRNYGGPAMPRWSLRQHGGAHVCYLHWGVHGRVFLRSRVNYCQSDILQCRTILQRTAKWRRGLSLPARIFW